MLPRIRLLVSVFVTWHSASFRQQNAGTFGKTVRSGLTPLLEALDDRHVRQEGWEERSEASAADRARLFRRAATPAIVVGGGSSWGNGTAIAADCVLKLSGFFRRGLDSAGDGA